MSARKWPWSRYLTAGRRPEQESDRAPLPEQPAIVEPHVYHVLVAGPERIEGASVVSAFQWIDVSEEQYNCYSEGNPGWRSATDTGGWLGRGWRRLTGGDA